MKMRFSTLLEQTLCKSGVIQLDPRKSTAESPHPRA